MRTTERLLSLALWLAVTLGAVLLPGCSKSSPPAAETAQTPVVKSDPAPAAPAADSKPSGAVTVASLFPGGPGKELVLSTCGSCHPVVCSAIGQRTAERWESLKNGHKDKLTSVTTPDLEAMFAYLKAAFNESKPEPKVPPEFLQQGCTPY